VIAPAAGTVDLQVHSTASDGAAAPADIPAAAAAAQLSAFALTDHDSTGGVAEAAAAAERVGVRVIAGVELSAMHDAREVHLLGLHLSVMGPMEVRLGQFRAERADRATAIVARLQTLGINITFEDVAREAGRGAFGRPHIARALIAAGAVRDFREAFDRYLGAGRPAFVPKPMLSAGEAIALVHDAGGLAVWAHPGVAGRRDALEALVALGLDGVEVLHPGHSPEDVSRLKALSDHLGILPSGGSDWHGDPTGSRTLGAMRVPVEWLERQDALVASRRAAGVA
jgi:predicted metal-dependent phosphoesterase TrpH